MLLQDGAADAWEDKQILNFRYGKNLDSVVGQCLRIVGFIVIGIDQSRARDARKVLVAPHRYHRVKHFFAGSTRDYRAFRVAGTVEGRVETGLTTLHK